MQIQDLATSIKSTSAPCGSHAELRETRWNGRIVMGTSRLATWCGYLATINRYMYGETVCGRPSRYAGCGKERAGAGVCRADASPSRRKSSPGSLLSNCRQVHDARWLPHPPTWACWATAEAPGPSSGPDLSCTQHVGDAPASHTSGTGSWTTYGQRDINRNYGSHASTTSARSSSRAGRMLGGRCAGDQHQRSHALQLLRDLADGVRAAPVSMAQGTLATGGNSSGTQFVAWNRGHPAEQPGRPEIGRPSPRWPSRASTTPLHSSCPMGGVGGGGICGDCEKVGYLAEQRRDLHTALPVQEGRVGQLAPRPTISSAPSAAGYGSQIQIGTPDASSIQKVALVSGSAR